jgi:hypothetical protein
MPTRWYATYAKSHAEPDELRVKRVGMNAHPTHRADPFGANQRVGAGAPKRSATRSRK